MIRNDTYKIQTQLACLLACSVFSRWVSVYNMCIMYVSVYIKAQTQTKPNQVMKICYAMLCYYLDGLQNEVETSWKVLAELTWFCMLWYLKCYGNGMVFECTLYTLHSTLYTFAYIVHKDRHTFVFSFSMFRSQSERWLLVARFYLLLHTCSFPFFSSSSSSSLSILYLLHSTPLYSMRLLSYYFNALLCHLISSHTIHSILACDVM